MLTLGWAWWCGEDGRKGNASKNVITQHRNAWRWHCRQKVLAIMADEEHRRCHGSARDGTGIKLIAIGCTVWTPRVCAGRVGGGSITPKKQHVCFAICADLCHSQQHLIAGYSKVACGERRARRSCCWALAKAVAKACAWHHIIRRRRSNNISSSCRAIVLE